MITVPVQIRFNDVDMAHHVHNAIYLHWFELARMALLQRFIPKGHDWRAQGLILARNEVDYRMPVLLNDTIEASTWCDHIGHTSFDLRYAITRSSGERTGICAEGRSVLVCYDYTNSRPLPLPAAWRERLNELNRS